MADDVGAAFERGDRAGGTDVRSENWQGSGKSFGVQFMDDLWGAVEALLDRQKRQAGDQIAEVAEMLRRAGQSADPEDDLGVATLGRRLADEIEGAADDIRQRPWGLLMADVEQFARRQPAVFVVGAVAAGFAAERFLAASESRSRAGEFPPGEPHSGASTTPKMPAPPAGAALAGSSGDAEDGGESAVAVGLTMPNIIEEPGRPEGC